MTTRPTDWSALGLDTDPTPGDPDQVQDVYNLLNSLSQDYQTIYDTLQTVNGYASSDNLVGQTADALRKQMNGRITNFVESASHAFPQVASAVNTYLTALNTQQGVADGLLTQAQNSGLKSDDPQIKTWATQAQQAGSDLQSAEGAAAKAVQSAPGPSNPLSPWQEFLEILGWIALLLILPAMVFGGFVALIEFVVNAVLFVNALVQFAEGNLSFGGLLLAALGVIAPTTRALDLGEIVNVIKGIGSSVKTGIVSVRGGLGDFIGLLTSRGLGDLLSIDSLVALGAFTLRAGVWVFNGLKDMPSLVIKGADLFASKLGELITTGVEKLYTSFRTGGFISAFLPVDAAEIEKLGLVAGLRLGFVDRGLSFFPRETGLGDVVKTGFAGVHVGDLTTNGFGRVVTPHLDVAGFHMPDAATLRTSSLDTNIGKLGFDAHLEAPHLSINNFAVSLVHSDLGLGKLSGLTPVGFRIGHLEIPDLRTPPELGRIGQGTVITHMSDISFVTVHEDLVPQVVHADVGAISTPTLRTGDVAVPSLHVGDVPMTSPHAGGATIPSQGLHIGETSGPVLHDDAPTLTTAHLSTGFHDIPTSAVPALHTADMTIPTVRLGDLTGVVARPPAAHDLPSLGAIAHTKVSIARPDEVTLTRTDSSLSLTTTPHLGDAASSDAFAHLVPPTTMPHAVTESAVSGLDHGVSTPAHLTVGDAGSKGSMEGLEGSVEHLGQTSGLETTAKLDMAGLETTHLESADLSVTTSSAHDALVVNAPAPHLESSAPAASSAGLDEIAAHSAGAHATQGVLGAHGAHVTDPDLAGKPGLIDPNAERVAVHWTDFKQSQHEYQESLAAHQQAFAQHDPASSASGSSVVDPKGKLPMTFAQLLADHDLRFAAGKLEDAGTALHELDEDPARLKAAEADAVLDSLRERPRLLGGSREGDTVLRADPETGLPIRSARGLGSSRLQLNIDHLGDHEFGTVVRGGDDTPVYAGRLTELEGAGGFRLTSAEDASVFREYHPDGTMGAQGLRITDHLGQPAGHLHIDPDGGAASLRPHGGADPRELRFNALNDGGFRLSDPADDSWIRIGADGRTLGQSIRAADHDDTHLGVVEVDFAAGRARFAVPGVGHDDWAFADDARGGFTLTGADHTVLRFDQGGRLVGRDQDVARFDDEALGRLEVDYADRSATLTALDGHQTVFAITTVRDGEHLLTGGRPGEWVRIGADGRTLARSIRAADHDDTDLGVVEVDFAAGRAHFAVPGVGHDDWAFADDARGGFTLTGADHSALHFDQGGRLVGRDRDVVHFDDEALGRLEVDYADRSATLTALDGHQTAFAITNIRAGEHLLTNGHTGEWIRVDPDGRVVARSVGIRDHDGTALNDLGVDFRTRQAEFTRPDGAQEQWDFTQNTAGFTLTRADGHRLDFSGDGRLLEQHAPLHGTDAVTDGTWLHADFTPPGGPVLAVHDANGGIGHLTVTRTATGHYRVTDTRVGDGDRTFTDYDRFAGTVRGGRADLLDRNQMFIEFDNTGARPAMTISDGDGPVGHLRPTRDAQTGDIVITDTRGVHDGNARTYSAHGAPLREHITITTPRGRDTGQHFEVDYTTMRWARNDARGPIAPRSGRPEGDAAGFDVAYNGAGSVTRKNDGALVLNGEDKTSVYTREKLTTGQTLELTRQSNGSRYWTTWDARGMTAWGRRHFSTESDGVHSWDLGRRGQTLREYRAALDKGTIRAERMPDGSFSWARFTKDGDLTFSGTREFNLGGWTDKVTIGTDVRVAQRKWNAWSVLGRASHYRENAVSFDANLDTYVLKETYKEISQQAKDAGSKEMTDGHWLEFTRYAEQRPPDFLWKTPESLDNPVARAVAKSPLGSKYGAIDFPHEGAVHGDARFQVFKWAEHEAANGGGIVSRGVRVLTPDGSFSDFAGDGLFVRGAIKLDDGHTVEIGRAANGKWDTFALNGDARPADTLSWRELDSGKNVVNQGVRTFHGKQWIDHYTDGQGLARVARHTDTDGNVVHYTAAADDRPRFDPGRPFGRQVQLTGDEISVTRNTMSQLVERADHWGGQIRAAGPVRVTGHGDPRVGSWEWRDANDGHGVRVSGRNTRGTGAWDDSYADFRTNPFTHAVEQIRDLRDLGKGTSLRAERDATLTWRSWKYDARGQVVDRSEGIRQWKQPDGTFGAARPSGMKAVEWRDVRADDAGFTLRELVDGRVREYGDRGGQTWKEYNFGSVWRERTQVPGRNGLYLEKESFQKQWRVTNADGKLIRFRSAAGNVWERDTFGRWGLGSSGGWTKVGREYEDKGLMTDLRGFNRRVREPNRFQFKEPGLFRPDAGDGAVGEFVGAPARLGQKTFFDVLQDFTIDVGANIIITGATDDWDFNGDAWGRILLGGALRSGIKGIYGVLTETALKGFRDGLRNLDGGKDWNRNPYNNDKHWDNEWGGNENPPRWRANVFDFGVGQVAVPALANFVSNAVTSAVFGVGKDDVKLSGLDALKAGGLAMAGGVVGSLSAGAVRTLGHQLFSGRLFHQGGLSDFTLQFGEKLFLDYIVNELIEARSGLEAGAVAKNV